MIKYHYKSRLLRLFPDWVLGFTFGRHVFFRDANPSPTLMRHEVVHVAQFEKHGIIGFLWIYLWKERKLPYREKTFEKEAYAASGELNG